MQRIRVREIRGQWAVLFKTDAEAYEKSGDYDKMLAKFKNMIAEEPVLKSYQITASSEPLLLRIF